MSDGAPPPRWLLCVHGSREAALTTAVAEQGLVDDIEVRPHPLLPLDEVYLVERELVGLASTLPVIYPPPQRTYTREELFRMGLRDTPW